MSFRRFHKFHKGEVIGSKPLFGRATRMDATLADYLTSVADGTRALTLTAEAPLEVASSSSGQQISIRDPAVIHALLSGTGPTYSWTEQVYGNSGWINGPRSGTNNALEINNVTNLGGMRVPLRRSTTTDEYLFQWISGAQEDPPACLPCDLPDADLDATFAYPTGFTWPNAPTGFGQVDITLSFRTGHLNGIYRRYWYYCGAVPSGLSAVDSNGNNVDVSGKQIVIAFWCLPDSLYAQISFVDSCCAGPDCSTGDAFLGFSSDKADEYTCIPLCVRWCGARNIAQMGLLIKQPTATPCIPDTYDVKIIAQGLCSETVSTYPGDWTGPFLPGVTIDYDDGLNTASGTTDGNGEVTFSLPVSGSLKGVIASATATIAGGRACPWDNGSRTWQGSFFPSCASISMKVPCPLKPAFICSCHGIDTIGDIWALPRIFDYSDDLGECQLGWVSDGLWRGHYVWGVTSYWIDSVWVDDGFGGGYWQCVCVPDSGTLVTITAGCADYTSAARFEVSYSVELMRCYSSYGSQYCGYRSQHANNPRTCNWFSDWWINRSGPGPYVANGGSGDIMPAIQDTAPEINYSGAYTAGPSGSGHPFTCPYPAGPGSFTLTGSC